MNGPNGSNINPSPPRDSRSQGKAPRQAKEKPQAPHAFPPDLIKCAECFNCKQFRSPVPGTNGRYFIMARCAAGRWKRRGKQVPVHIHRALTRSRHACDDYETTSESAGDRLAFLYALKESLPEESHMYEPDGSFVDKIEQYKICLNAT
jgi:hypothetical protein